MISGKKEGSWVPLGTLIQICYIGGISIFTITVIQYTIKQIVLFVARSKADLDDSFLNPDSDSARLKIKFSVFLSKNYLIC